jgi:DNA-directed RNA polymerase subunit RPC12/RpoP
MLVECSNCGAPLDVNEERAYTTCAYCRHKSLTRHLHTVANQTPAGWQPPAEWRPPQYLGANSETTLRYRSTQSNSAVWVLVGLLVVSGAAGAVFVMVGTTSVTNSVTVDISEPQHDVAKSTSPPRVDTAQQQAISEAMRRLQELAQSAPSAPGDSPVPEAPPGQPVGGAPAPAKPPPKAAPRATPPSRDLAWDVAHRLKALNYKNCFFQDMSPPQNGMFPLRYTTRVTLEGRTVKGISVSGQTNKGPDGFRWKDFKRNDPITAADVAATEAKVKGCIKGAARRLSLPDNSSKGTVAVEFTGVDLISASGFSN